MAAPTNAANVKKALANPEPSTHGPERTSEPPHEMSALEEERTPHFMSTRPSTTLADCWSGRIPKSDFQ